MIKKKTYTTFDIAKILDVYPSTVAKWIDEGKLRAFTTPGGHRRVKEEDLVDFLEKHRIPVPDDLKKKEKKVLVVDDDTGILKLFEKFFKRKFKGIKLFTAKDAFSAGIILKEEKPQLIFLDIKLPGIDGYNVLEKIKKNPDLKNTKVVVISGYEAEREKTLKKGVFLFLKKPFTLEEIETIIKKFF